MVEPPGDQKPNWWIARELAVRLGLGAYFPWKHVEEYLDVRLKGAGSSLLELKEKGVVAGPHQPIYFEEGVAPELPTPSGKIELYSLQLAEAGFDPTSSFHSSSPPRRM